MPEVRDRHCSPRRLLGRISSAVLATFALTGDSGPPQSSLPVTALSAIQARAEKFNVLVDAPAFETTSDQLQATLTNTVAAANASLNQIGSLDEAVVTFDNTVGALDDLRSDVANVSNRLFLIGRTSTDPALREGASAAFKSLQQWIVGLDYREDVYRSLVRYAGTKPELVGEEQKLLSDTLRDYRRAGLELPRAHRDRVEQWRKELETLSTDFQNNVTNAVKAVTFARSALEGVPDAFLQEIKSGNDEAYAVMVNVTYQYALVMENAKSESTRKRLETERSNLARQENVPLIERILPLRARIARALGYSSWADYTTEVRMAGNARTATDFLEGLNTALRPNFNAELAAYRRLKARETGDPEALVNSWDWRYYSNLLKREKYSVDAEQLRVYFPYQRVLEGMFAIYQRIFGLTFERIDTSSGWIEDVPLYAVSDGQTGEPLGLFYLDMFPRAGKYNHFAQFPITDGRQLSNGKHRRPVVALVCNFPPPSGDRPSLLSHHDVQTLFHEFGHAMHAILTRARFARFSGTNVPRDFVEAPSQMLEKWTWDGAVLNSFAADYRDPSRKVPAEMLAKLKEARLAAEGMWYQRVFVAFGLMDLALHTGIDEKNAREAVPMANDIVSRAFLPVPQGTAPLASFGHFAGYDAGFYGYAWADAIAADMATVFETAPGRYFDEDAGRRLRGEIYEPGDSRDVNVSIEKFLGRQRSLEPLLRQLGVGRAVRPEGRE